MNINLPQQNNLHQKIETNPLDVHGRRDSNLLSWNQISRINMTVVCREKMAWLVWVLLLFLRVVSGAEQRGEVSWNRALLNLHSSFEWIDEVWEICTFIYSY